MKSLLLPIRNTQQECRPVISIRKCIVRFLHIRTISDKKFSFCSVFQIHQEFLLTLLTFKYLTDEAAKAVCSAGPYSSSFSRGVFLVCTEIVFMDQRKHEKDFSKQTN